MTRDCTIPSRTTELNGVARLLTPVCAVLLVACLNTESCRGDDWTAESFDQRIAPILAEHCLSCHSGAEPEGKLDLSEKDAAREGGESGNALAAGSLDKSLIWQRISAGEMPPDDPLPDHDQQLIRAWIEDGAVWGTNPIDTFRYSSTARAGYDWWSLQPVRRPEVPNIERATHPIDAFVRQRLSAEGLTSSGRASAREIIRRMSFDLIGLPPTPEEVDALEVAWQEDSTTALNELVGRLLASPHVGERWARHWLDVARFGESQGFERDKLRDNSWHYRDWVIRALNDDMPYDEFARLQLAGDVLNPDDADAIIATGFLVAGPWDEVGQSQKSQAMRAVVRQDEMEDYVGTIGQAFLGLTVNCARCHDHKFDPIRQKEYYQLTAAVSGVHHGSRDVTDSVAHAKSSASGDASSPQKFSVYAVKPSEPEAAFLLARGNPAARLEQVTPGGIAAVRGLHADFQSGTDASDAQRRRKLAEWISSANNPLFARVIVNRLWHHHFGAGLVETPNDFGFNGGLPSHPELLDYLASELIDSGFSLKHIHRLIVTSETWLQSSRHRSEPGAIDAQNRLLWRKSPERLDAETLRDSVLFVSGQLNPKTGGAPYQDFKTFTNNSQFYEMIDPDDPAAYRRTVYRTWIRSGRNHLLDVFDCPDPSTTAPKRSVTTTPLQALTMMNSSFLLRMADRFAERITAEVGTDVTDQISRAYRLAYCRSPDERETEVAAAFIANHGLPAYCRVIFNSNEFIHVD